MTDESFTEQVASILERQLSEPYEEFAFKLINTLKQGLGNFQFNDNKKPIEITQIENLISASSISNITNMEAHSPGRHKTLVELMTNLTLAIHALQANIDLGNLQANNFVFQAAHAFDGLSWFMITDYTKYIEAFMNPSAKATDLPKKRSWFKKLKNVPEDFTSGMLSNMMENAFSIYTKESGHSYENDYYDAFRSAGELLKKTPVEKLPREKRSSSKILKDILQKHPAPKTPVKVTVLSAGGVAESASEAMDREIHNLSFDSYYTQIALFVEMQLNIEKIYQNSPGSTRAEIYSRFGLEEASSKESFEFFNSVAEVLGFKNATDLYNNYAVLSESLSFITEKSTEAAEIFYNKKNIFGQFSLQEEGTRSQDPLTKIENAYAKERARVQEKRKVQTNGSYDKNNYSYIATLNYVTKIYVPTVNYRRGTKNLLAQVFTPPQNDPKVPTSRISNIFLSALNTLLPRFNIVEKAVQDVERSTITLEQILTETNSSIKDSLGKLEDKINAERKKEREEYFKTMFENQYVNLEKLIADYGNKVATGKGVKYHDAKNFDILASLFNLEFDNSEELNKKNEQLKAEIDRREKQNQEPVQNLTPTEKPSLWSKIRTGITNSNKKIANSARGFRDFIASGLGIQTKSLKEKAEKQEIGKGEIKALKLIQGRMQARLNTQNATDILSVNVLIENFSDHIKELSKIQEKILEEMRFATWKNYEKPLFVMRNFQKRYYENQFNLLADQQAILRKLTSDSEPLTKNQVDQIKFLNQELLSFNQKQQIFDQEIPLLDLNAIRYNSFKNKINHNAALIYAQYQPSLLKAYQGKIISDLVHLDVPSTETEPKYEILDPPNFVMTVIKDLLPVPKDLNESLLKNYFEFLEKKLIEILKSDTKQSVSLEDIEKLYETLFKLAKNSPEQPYYINILEAVGKHIEAASQNLSNEKYAIFLENATTHLLKNIQEFSSSQQALKAASSAKQSWRKNPFGSTSHNKVVQDAERAHRFNQELLTEMLQRNLNFSKVLIDKIKDNPVTLNKQELEKIKSQLANLRALFNSIELDEPTKKAYVEVISKHKEILKLVFDQSKPAPVVFSTPVAESVKAVSQSQPTPESNVTTDPKQPPGSKP